MNAGQAQEFEAPARVLALVRDTALELGAAPEQASEAARTGVLDLESGRIAVVFSADEESIVLAAGLPADLLDEPARRITALKASLVLLLQAGVAFAKGPAGPALMGRWPIATAQGALLAAWVRQFAAMAQFAGTTLRTGKAASCTTTA
jgi:hypothetical protein